MVSLFILPGRKVFQKVTHEGGSWKDELSPVHRAEWEKWRLELCALKDVKVRRCFKPPNFEVVTAELHSFSDASDYGYGQASYLRQVSVTDEISVSLVMAKSRVVPLKPPTSVPRMELAAAWTSAETATSVADELGIDGLVLYFWVDNMIVLGYIRNDKKRFRTYVAKRSKKIRNITEKAAWGHVSTDLNPADDASRGLSVSEERKVFRWFNGPDILWSPGGMSSQSKGKLRFPILTYWWIRLNI
jgi:hypothetical protein